MDHFNYKNRVLHCEDVPVPELAEAYGTPLYIYSRATLVHHLVRTGGRYGLATMCVGVGQGIACVLERA